MRHPGHGLAIGVRAEEVRMKTRHRTLPALLVMLFAGFAVGGVSGPGTPLLGLFHTNAAWAEGEIDGGGTGYTGHLHREPDGGYFCHCGSSPNCTPCG